MRMIRYSLTMGIRMACIVSLLFVQGWWLLVMAIGAIVLPYLAVVLANVSSRPAGVLERPGGVVARRTPPQPYAAPTPTAPDDSDHPDSPAGPRSGNET